MNTFCEISLLFLAGMSRQDFIRAQAILQRYAYKWEEIALCLHFTYEEISIIKANPALLAGAPTSYLSAMLAEWQQWAPGDARGSTDSATLGALKEAVDRAGLDPLIIQELHNLKCKNFGRYNAKARH